MCAGECRTDCDFRSIIRYEIIVILVNAKVQMMVGML